MITTVSGLTGSIESWEENVSPLITIGTTQEYTLAIMMEEGAALSGAFSNLVLEVGQVCGNKIR